MQNSYKNNLEHGDELFTRRTRIRRNINRVNDQMDVEVSFFKLYFLLLFFCQKKKFFN